MSTSLKYCILIPCYEKHSLKLKATVLPYLSFNIPIIVIDDGSSMEYAAIIKEICEKNSLIYIRSGRNVGKGGAMKLGFKKALELGFSHGIQVDADGQHEAKVLSEILELSQKNPTHLISGKPIYDDSVPKGRKWGRYLTHIWVWIETLSFELEDSMCGFRSYPVTETLAVIENETVGNRMDFDSEIMVRLYWRGVSSLFVPTKVIYPEDGESYFHVLKDNVHITKMHTRLFFGMLFRFPKLLWNNIKKKQWHQIDERGLSFLINFTSWIQDTLGQKVVNFILWWISFYYYLFSFRAKKSSHKYSVIYKNYCRINGIEFKAWGTFEHIKQFARMVLDKFSVWKGKIDLSKFSEEDVKRFRSLYEEKKGIVFISSHFGNIELIRCLGRKNQRVKYNALIYGNKSQKIFKILKKINPDFEERVIFVENFGPEVGAMLQEKVAQGEWIFCMGDRVGVNSSKNMEMTLLDEKINLPLGPFIMCYLLNAKVFSVHCYEGEGEYKIQVNEITSSLEKSRQNREEIIKEIAQNYLKDLEGIIVKRPYQWFNFYDYWKDFKG